MRKGLQSRERGAGVEVCRQCTCTREGSCSRESEGPAGKPVLTRGGPEGVTPQDVPGGRLPDSARSGFSCNWILIFTALAQKSMKTCLRSSQ